MMNMHRQRTNSLRCNGVTWEVACVCGQTFAMTKQAAVEEVLRLHVAEGAKEAAA